MKKLLKNKKVIVSLVLVLGIMLAGITYAWFTVNALPSDTDIQTGRLRLDQYRYEVYYEVDEDDEIIDPNNPIYVYYNLVTGEVVDQRLDYPEAEGFDQIGRWLDPTGLIQPSSSGSIGFMIANPNPDGLALAETVKIGNTLSEIVIWSKLSEDGLNNAVPLETPEIYANMAALVAAHDDVNATDLTYSPDSAMIKNIQYVVGGNVVGTALWMYDANLYNAKTGEGELQYYVSLSALPNGYDAELEMISYLKLDDAANNRFQGSQVKVTSHFESTQAITDACKAKWGSNINLMPVTGMGAPVQVVLNSAPGFKTAATYELEASVRSLTLTEAKGMDELALAQFFFPDMF